MLPDLYAAASVWETAEVSCIHPAVRFAVIFVNSFFRLDYSGRSVSRDHSRITEASFRVTVNSQSWDKVMRL